MEARSAPGAGRGARAAATLLLLASPLARAQGTDLATAQALFDEARALSEQGHFTEACPKLEESQRLDPGLGTQLNLADCYEHLGKLASAWALFVAVESTARRNNDERRTTFAHARTLALAPRLSRLRILVAPQEAEVSVTRDRVGIGKAQWGVALPIDPGVYFITARATERQSWSVQVEVREPGQELLVRIPELAPAAPSAAASASAAPPSSATSPGGSPAPWSGREKLAAGLAAGGVLAVGTGVVLGLVALHKYRAVAAGCDDDGACDEPSRQERLAARRIGNAGTIVGVSGALLGGAAAYLWLTRGERASAAAGAWLFPAIGAREAGLIAQGRF